MKIFETFYRKNSDNIKISSVKVIKYNFCIFYLIPVIPLIIGIKERFILLIFFSLCVAGLFYNIDGVSANILLLKIMLLFSFALIVPDIIRFELNYKGYINGGCFVVKNKDKCLKMFFKSLNL